MLIKINVKESIANEIASRAGSGKLDLANDKKTEKLLIDSNIPKWVIPFLSKVIYLQKRKVIDEIALLTYRLAWFKKEYTKEFYKVLFRLTNNEELLEYKDLGQIEIWDELQKIDGSIKNVSDYNSMQERNNDVINISHKETLLYAIMEIRFNQTLMDYLLKDIVN